MKPIGGFFELELPASGQCYHPAALALSTGRACLRLALQRIRPSRVFAPFYACDALYEPLRILGIPFEYYALDEQLEPRALPDLGDDEWLLVVDFFGVRGASVDALIARHSPRVLVDDTHAFFRRGRPEIYSFTSARKYFGVPDGAYLYGPETLDGAFPRFEGVSLEHAMNRLLGRQQLAFQQFQAYERSLNSELENISVVSERLLAQVDYEAVARRRIANFEYLHAHLGSHNLLSIPASLPHAPFCYPLHPGRPIDRKALYEEQIFVPSLWLDTRTRGVEGFEFEKHCSEALLPLPIDHRYGPEDMDRIIDHLLRQLA